MAVAAVGHTIVALSSGRPPAAIAVVRTSGPAALVVAESMAGPLGEDRKASLHSLRDPRDGSIIDRALILSFTAPHTATGEDIVEYQCHGSKAVVELLIAALTSFPGVREALPGEFTRRALINGKIDLTQAEGLAELLEAETEAQRKSALRRSEGALRARIERWREAVLGLAAEAEVAIDHADEEDGADGADPHARIEALGAEMAELLAAPRVEKLRDGVRVVVAGPPNAGKSSLVNALAGQERAIVTAIAGTTRDRIEVPLSLGGVPLVLVDTAGLRESEDPIEQIGVGLARCEVEEADILLWLGGDDDAPSHANLIILSAKSDLGRQNSGFEVSARTGAGLERVKSMLTRRSSGIVPSESQLALNRREAGLLEECRDALMRCASLADPVLQAEELRVVRHALDQISGRAGVEQLLDALFSRFCLGK